MRGVIRGLHHVTTLASGARANDAFHTGALGLRRVKATVNFDAPDGYPSTSATASGPPAR